MRKNAWRVRSGLDVRAGWAKLGGMSRISFRVVLPILPSSEDVLVVGDSAVLGGWQPSGALRLRGEGAEWVGEIEVESGTDLEYKIIRGSWEAEEVDAYGHVGGNHRHHVWLDATLSHTVADWKDSYCGRLTPDRVHSRALAGWRDLLVWLPEGYGSAGGQRYPVVYLHDGANVFNPATSVISGVDLAADEWVSCLARRGGFPSAIVVGICHPDGFAEEGCSMRDFDLSPELGGAAYADFLAAELVGHIDARYRTLARPEARILGGVSLGALNTLFTMLRHPGVFGKGLGLSTSFEDVSLSVPSQSRQLRALADLAALPPDCRMYFDYGSHGLDECYEPYHAELGALLREKGWRDGREFLIAKIPDGTHDERSWRQRLGPGLEWIARPQNA